MQLPEDEPLGKAEWIKLFGALYCREKMADSILLHTRREYNSIKEKVAAHSSSRPSVLLGFAVQGYMVHFSRKLLHQPPDLGCRRRLFMEGHRFGLFDALWY
jgi:ABC-type Fe3+-hydroxamate transport system substrate-binding protein